MTCIKGLVEKECSVAEACTQFSFTCGREVPQEAIDCLKESGVVREMEGVIIVDNISCPTAEVYDNVIPLIYNNKLYCVEVEGSRYSGYCIYQAVQYVKSLGEDNSNGESEEGNQEGSQGEDNGVNEEGNQGEEDGGSNNESGNGGSGGSQGEDNSSGGSRDGTSQGNESGNGGSNNEQKQEIVFKMADWLSMDIMGIPLWMWLAGLGLLLIFL
jgi:hypothetical protein